MRGLRMLTDDDTDRTVEFASDHPDIVAIHMHFSILNSYRPIPIVNSPSIDEEFIWYKKPHANHEFSLQRAG